MTALRTGLRRSASAKFAGLLVIVGSMAFHALAQTGQPGSIGLVAHSTNHKPVAAPASDVIETSGGNGTSESTQRLLIPNSEIKPKPDLPVSVVQEMNAADESRAAELLVAGSRKVEPEGVVDPAWRPFEMPRQSRFLKEKQTAPDSDDEAENAASQKFHWRPAILQSVIIQGFQLTYALTVQEKTRRALKGPFLEDYWESIKGVRGWDDGNKFFTNYIAHPMQGGMTGFIFVQNHDRAKKQKFGESKQYWKDRFKAFVWSAAWSTNWELGPISQSSIGNVGLYGKQGYVDLVITPTVGTGWLLTEEALDRYVIRHLETKGVGIKMLARTFLNPMRAVANLLRFKEPWYRDRPFGT